MEHEQFRNCHTLTQRAVFLAPAAKQALLSAMSSEPEASIRRKLLHCIGQVSAFLPSGEPWPEVLQLTSQLIQDAQNHSSREVGFRLLDRLAEYNAELLTAVLPQVPTIHHQRHVE